MSARFTLFSPCFIWLTLLLFFCITTSYAQDAKADSAALNGLYGDFTAPDLAAPTLLGVNASQVSKPANVRALTGSLLGAAGLQQNGSGVGVEVAPVLFLRRPVYKGSGPQNITTSLAAYRDPINRLTRGFTLSGASITDSTSAKVAFGAALVLIDKTDPLLDNYRVQAISRQLAQLHIISILHNGLASNGTSAVLEARSLVDRELGTAPGTQATRQALSTGLSNIMLFPLPPTQTPAAFSTDRLGRLTIWNTAVDVLVISGTITSAQAIALKTGAAPLVQHVIDQYAGFQADVSEFNMSTQAVVKSANESFTKRLWNATIVQAGAGWTWSSSNKAWRGLDKQSFGFFMRGAFRVADSSWRASPHKVQQWLYHHAQAVALVQYNDYHTATADLPKKPTATADSLNHKWFLGGRVLVGNSSFRLSGEYLIQRYSFTQTAQDAAALAKRKLREDVRSATIGAEVRLSESLWLEFAFGTTFTTGEREEAKLLTLGSLKYALRNKQRFKTN